MSASNKERKVPVLVDKPMDFCPGCGHGIISRLIMECLDELEQSDNIIFPIGVGCSSNLGAGLECDRLHCSHGRAGAVATGMKRVNPDVLIVSYQGDGDAYNIGIAETFNAAYRNENITVIVVESVKSSLNRTIYKTIIPRNVRLAEAPSHGMSINLYDSRSTGAESYRMLAAEVMSRGEEL